MVPVTKVAASGIVLPNLGGQPGPVKRSLEIVVGHVDTAKKDLDALKTTVSKLPDSTGPLSSTQIDHVRQQLLGSNNLLQSIQGFSSIPNVPLVDPKVKGTLWNDGGLLRVSQG